MVLYITIDVYTAIMKKKMPIYCLRGSVGRAREYSTVIFKRCVVSSNPIRDIYYCKDFCFLFLLIFLLFAISFLHSVLFDLISDKNIISSDP